MIGLWNCLKRKKTSNGRLGPRGRKDRIEPNKNAHISLISGFRDFPVPIVPGYFTHFSVFALWPTDWVHNVKLAMAKGGNGGEIKPTCHSTFRTEHDCVHKTSTGV